MDSTKGEKYGEGEWKNMILGNRKDDQSSFSIPPDLVARKVFISSKKVWENSTSFWRRRIDFPITAPLPTKPPRLNASPPPSPPQNTALSFSPLKIPPPPAVEGRSLSTCPTLPNFQGFELLIRKPKTRAGQKYESRKTVNWELTDQSLSEGIRSEKKTIAATRTRATHRLWWWASWGRGRPRSRRWPRGRPRRPSRGRQSRREGEGGAMGRPVKRF